MERDAGAHLDRQRLAVGRPRVARRRAAARSLSFSSMSNSLSHSAANTMRPTNVRASVGSSTSGSSASPKRSVCAARRPASSAKADGDQARAGGAQELDRHRCSGMRVGPRNAGARDEHSTALDELNAPRETRPAAPPAADCARRSGADGRARGAISRQKWQATAWPSRRRRAAAPPRRSAARACGQRVRKRQPDGGSRGLGTSPSSRMRAALAARDRAPGSPTSSACV